MLSQYWKIDLKISVGAINTLVVPTILVYKQLLHVNSQTAHAVSLRWLPAIMCQYTPESKE